LQPHLQSDRIGLSYAEIAIKHGMSESAVKVAVHRVRQRYGMILREEIARTVSCESEIEEELRHLIRVISDAP
jgi:RNA polymerase sigma-70 factor (ECF subfamily)